MKKKLQPGRVKLDQVAICILSKKAGPNHFSTLQDTSGYLLGYLLPQGVFTTFESSMNLKHFIPCSSTFRSFLFKD